jgi:Secretory pathway protein Sec39
MNAAIDFFDNDQEGDQNKGLMKQSRTCCSLLPSSIPAIKAHLDLIEATHVLITKYKLAVDNYTRIMPIQIRLHEDRVKIFEPLLASNPELYSKKSIVSDLATKLLGGAADFPRSKAFLSIWTAGAALKSENDGAAYHLCLESLSILETHPNLVSEILPEILDILPQIATKSKDAMGSLYLSAKTLIASSTGKLPASIEHWRKSLCQLSVDGSFPHVGEISSEILYKSVEDRRLLMPYQVHNNVEGPERFHDFFKPLGSSIGAIYFHKSEFEGQPCVLKSRLDCLKLQNSIRTLHQGDFPRNIQHDHSFAIAKELFAVDSVLSTAYLLSCKFVVFE